MSVRRATGRWTGIRAIALLAAGVGILARDPGTLLLAGVAVGFAALSRLGGPPEPTIEVERTVSETDPEPGEPVEVQVGVRNAGDRWLGDVRVVDGVPDGLPVVDGAPRHGTALPPGGSVTFGYALRAERGRHRFDPVRVTCRSVSGAFETEAEVGAATEVRCVPRLTVGTETVPLNAHASLFPGRVPTARGGPGVEFHAVREYRPGDSLHRIDWARRARTGELSTVEFREERSATVVVLVDAREPAYVAPRRGERHAVEHGVEAAGMLFAVLLAEGNRAGLAALGREPCWLAPGTGRAHRARARELLATHPALAPNPPSGVRPFSRTRSPPSEPGTKTRGQVRDLRRRLPRDAQLVLVSPVADDAIVSVARGLAAYRHPVSVVSPDPTTLDTVGGRLAGVRRRRQLAELRAARIPAVDWRPDGPLAVALAAARRGSW